MSNRTGMIPTTKWYCQACGHQNDPEADNCYNCGADQDGIIAPVDTDEEL